MCVHMCTRVVHFFFIIIREATQALGSRRLGDSVSSTVVFGSLRSEQSAHPVHDASPALESW